jgi:hypothetical protein
LEYVVWFLRSTGDEPSTCFLAQFDEHDRMMLVKGRRRHIVTERCTHINGAGFGCKLPAVYKVHRRVAGFHLAEYACEEHRRAAEGDAWTFVEGLQENKCHELEVGGLPCMKPKGHNGPHYFMT